MLKPKRWAPVSTLEQKPDMISQRFQWRRYEPHADEWQVSMVYGYVMAMSLVLFVQEILKRNTSEFT